MHPPVKLIIIDRNQANIEAAWMAFQDEPMVEARRGDINSTTGYDCLITPGNSFGIMDGGFDDAVRALFGERIEPWIQQRILMEACGELNVGDAILTGTSPGGPMLCYAPTMRVPMQITRTDNVYRAMRAALIKIANHNDPDYSGNQKFIGIVVTPLLGAGAGKMPPIDSARQMRLAWDSMKDEYKIPTTLAEADAIQAAIGLGLGGDPDHY